MRIAFIALLSVLLYGAIKDRDWLFVILIGPLIVAIALGVR